MLQPAGERTAKIPNCLEDRVRLPKQKFKEFFWYFDATFSKCLILSGCLGSHPVGVVNAEIYVAVDL